MFNGFWHVFKLTCDLLVGVDLCFGGELFHTPDVFSGPTCNDKKADVVGLSTHQTISLLAEYVKNTYAIVKHRNHMY